MNIPLIIIISLCTCLYSHFVNSPNPAPSLVTRFFTCFSILPCWLIWFYWFIRIIYILIIPSHKVTIIAVFRNYEWPGYVRLSVKVFWWLFVFWKFLISKWYYFLSTNTFKLIFLLILYLLIAIVLIQMIIILVNIILHWLFKIKLEYISLLFLIILLTRRYLGLELTWLLVSQKLLLWRLLN
jgi:hypothetical protein